MKRVLLPIPVIAAVLWFMGCGTPTQTATNSPNQVSYSQGSSYTYKDNQLDTTDHPKASTTDTITSRVVATNALYQGRSNVSVLVNTHSNGQAADTTYIAQDAGSFWHYNYGLEALNNNAAVTAQTGGPIPLGWVLQAKFNANPGDKWKAADTTLTIHGFQTVVDVEAVEQTDTTIVVQGNSVPTKHVIHTITLTIGGTIPIAKTNVDTYVSSSVGVAINIVHSTTVSIPGIYSGPVTGRETVLLKQN